MYFLVADYFYIPSTDGVSYIQIRQAIWMLDVSDNDVGIQPCNFGYFMYVR